MTGPPAAEEMVLCRLVAILDFAEMELGRLRKVRQADVSRHRGSGVLAIVCRYFSRATRRVSARTGLLVVCEK